MVGRNENQTGDRIGKKEMHNSKQEMRTLKIMAAGTKVK